jgi:hypothetical protein
MTCWTPGPPMMPSHDLPRIDLREHVRLIPLALVGALLLTGCSDGSSDSDDARPEPTGSTSAPSSTQSGSVAFDEQTGTQIGAAGAAAMQDLTSLRYRLSVRGGDNPVAVDVRATNAGACSGSIALGDGRIQIRGLEDQQWFKADPEAWRQISPDHNRKLIRAAGDHWVKDAGFEVANFCFYQELLGSMFDELGSGTWFAAGADQIDGHDVMRVQSADSRTGQAVAAVRVDEPHFLAEYQRTDDSDGAVSTGRFSEFGVDVEVTAPDEDDVVDLSSLL